MFRILSYLFVTAIAFKSVGQNNTGQFDDIKVPSFLLPPPNAFQITKDAEIKPSLSTGTLNVSIPIFELPIGNSIIPFSLNYSSNGVGVDDVPSRVGINWSFNPGGVITRTILGPDDESSQLITPPVNPFNENQLAEYVYKIMPSSGSDEKNTQPDEYSFSFGGYSGKFFYDHTGLLRQSSHNNIKIEKNTSGSISIWKFKITTPEGVKYYFGGDQATEESKYTNLGCPRNPYSDYVPVSWYLNKIEYPNGEFATLGYTSINFSYPSGITQTVMALSYASPLPSGKVVWGSFPQVSSQNTCQNIYNCKGVVLQSILCSNGASVYFTYTPRVDIQGEQALQSITQFYNGSLVTKTVFSYANATALSGYKNSYFNSPPITYADSRLFLTHIFKQGSSPATQNTTIIEYDDMYGLPPRLSSAQDHFGYFNGKNNQFYIPTPTTVRNDFSINSDNVGHQVITNLQNRFGFSITANKEPDFNFAKKGSLKKITYPTGGRTEFEWDSNTVNKLVTVFPDPVTTIINATGTCPGPSASCSTLVTRYISTNYDQDLFLSGQSGSVYGADPTHSWMHVKVFNNLTNALIYSNSLSFNQSFQNYSFISAGTYRIELSSTTNDIPSSLTFTYRPGNISSEYVNVAVPGLRIKKSTDFDGMGNSYVTKYNYSSLSNPNVSTGQLLTTRYYQNVQYDLNTGGYWGPDQVPYIDGIITNYYDKFQSSTNYRSYLGGSNSINYAYVTESKGENFENGAIEHKYLTSYNFPGQILHGNDILFSPFADNNFMNAIEVETKLFAKKNNQFKLKNYTINDYSSDLRKFSWYDAYTVQSRNSSSHMYIGYPGNPYNLTQFDIIKYPRYTSWPHLDKVTNFEYDDNNNEIKTVKTITYDNPEIVLPGSESKIGSNNIEEKVVFKYIKDYQSIPGLSTATINAANLMNTKNIVNPILTKTITKNNSVIYKASTDFNIWNNQGLPEIMSNAIGVGASLTPKVRFLRYSNSGKAIEVAKENDNSIAYKWGYDDMYPILEAQNCSSDEIFYTSFEFGPEAIADQNAKTGDRVALNSYTVNFAKPNAKNYIISYHTWDGYKWNFTKQAYNNSSLTINAAKIDEVRIYPESAGKITTYTYKPLIGISSTCDENGKASYYEYDILNRLSIIRDQDNNILKKICYNYAGQTEDCTSSYSSSLPNWQNTTTALRCKQGNCGNTGYQEQEQKDMNLSSPTLNAIRWVEVSYNPTACPLQTCITLTSNNIYGLSGYTATYTPTAGGTAVTFAVPATSGLQTLGTIAAGSYTLTIQRTSGYPMMATFYSGCRFQSSEGTSATFYRVGVASNTCNSIIIDAAY